MALEASVFMAVQIFEPPVTNRLAAPCSEQRLMPLAPRSPGGMIEIELGSGSHVRVGSEANLRRVGAC